MSQETGRVTARQINETIRYTSWVTMSRSGPISNSTSAGEEFVELVEKAAGEDVLLRGAYDLTAMRADSDVMFWVHAPKAEQIQGFFRDLRRTEVGAILNPVWSATGLHRPAEFNKGHVPAFMMGTAPKQWLCVYPFVRSYEWYLLPEPERRAMLIEHGVMGRDYSGVISNTVASFALGDYEWLLALESDELHEIVDMMRHLRSSQARKHVRLEVPFYTGAMIEPAELAELIA